MSDKDNKSDQKPAKVSYKGQLGGVRPGSGRKGKAEEAKLVERLTPLDDTAFAVLSEAVEGGQQWAVKLFFEYRFGKPKQIVAIEQKKDEGEQVFVIGGKTIKL